MQAWQDWGPSPTCHTWHAQFCPAGMLLPAPQFSKVPHSSLCSALLHRLILPAGMLLPVPKFSKFLHGTALLFQPRCTDMPYWFLPGGWVGRRGRTDFGNLQIPAADRKRGSVQQVGGGCFGWPPAWLCPGKLPFPSSGGNAVRTGLGLMLQMSGTHPS